MARDGSKERLFDDSSDSSGEDDPQAAPGLQVNEAFAKRFEVRTTLFFSYLHLVTFGKILYFSCL